MSDNSGRDAVEEINAAIAAHTGGDHCHSAAHLMRVPGTTNYPTPAKRRRGRGETQAVLIQADNGTTVNLDQMAAIFPPQARASAERPEVEAGKYQLETPETLGLDPFCDIRNHMEQPEGSDRSSDAYWFAYMMKREGYTDAQVIGALLNAANPVAAHCVEADSPMRAATRALSAAKRKLAEKGADRGSGSNGAKGREGAPARPEGGGRPDISLIAAGSLNGKPVSERDFIVRKLAPAGLVTMFTAPGGGGKSHIALSMAASVATGAMAYGLKTTQATAIYITAEDDDDENHRRAIGAANAIGVSLETIGDRLLICSLVALRDKGLVRVDLNSNKLTVLPLYNVIRDHILETGARFVVLDNVAHFFEGNENIRAHVAGFIGLLNSLALETGAAIILISHPNKAGDSFSGSTAFQNQVRSHFHLEVDPNDPDARTLKLMKANYARLEEPLRLRWHNGAFQLEGMIPAGEGSASGRERQEEQRFLECLKARNETQRPVSMHATAAKSFAPREFAKMPQAGGMTADQFELAMNRLINRGVIAQVELDYQKPGSPRHSAVGLKQIVMVEASDEPF